VIEENGKRKHVVPYLVGQGDVDDDYYYKIKQTLLSLRLVEVV
jgi:hypothetical protein